ncbi:MAG: hypothetical protein JW797_20230 [Bradymonadales bacterium]|nr:hypothetical protein [Bradymonadales bacterium]
MVERAASPPRALAAGASSRYWSLVASFGTLWGAFEVTLGSFLHALRIPLVGVLLASIGASLLVAQRQICPRFGISLATAVIAALLKGFSPAGAIVGPMVAILMSGLLAELVLTIRPHTWFTAWLSGLLAVAWSIFQPLLTHTILYGVQVLSLYQQILIRLSRSLGISTTAGLTSIGLFVGVCCLVGGLASSYGWWMGQRVKERLAVVAPQEDGS